MEDKDKNIDWEEFREYEGMQQDNYIFEKQLKANTTKLIEELTKYEFKFEEPKKHKIPISKRAKRSVNNIFNKIAKIIGE